MGASLSAFRPVPAHEGLNPLRRCGILGARRLAPQGRRDQGPCGRSAKTSWAAKRYAPGPVLGGSRTISVSE